MDYRKSSGKRVVKFTRPNREPTNKLPWGQYTRDVTTSTIGKKRDVMEEKISTLLMSMPIEAGMGTVKSKAHEYTQTVKDMYQLRHASPNVVAIALYVLYQGINPPFNDKDPPDQAKIRKLLNQERIMDYFYGFANPGEDRKRKKDKPEDPAIKKTSLKAGILRYIEAIVRHVTGEISDLPEEIYELSEHSSEEEEGFSEAELSEEEEEQETTAKRGRGRPRGGGRGRGRGGGRGGERGKKTTAKAEGKKKMSKAEEKSWEKEKKRK